MIKKLTFSTVYVLNQERVYDFYVNKLCFKIHTDAPLGKDNRWLTVDPPDQPEIEISLLLVTEGEMVTKNLLRQFIPRDRLILKILHTKTKLNTIQNDRLVFISS